MDDTGARIRALRKRLGLSQDEVSTRGPIRREAVVKVEHGTNKASTVAIREGLARAFGITPGELGEYLAGQLSLEDVVRRSRVDAEPAVSPPQTAADDTVSPLERAAGQAFDPRRHLPRDLTAVLSALRSVSLAVDDPERLVEAARSWLDAAASLRAERAPVDAATLLVRSTAGKAPHAQAVEAEREVRASTEGDERARAQGMEPGSAAVEIRHTPKGPRRRA